MGAALVAKVLSDWTHVGDRAFRVLVRMALTALDRPKGDLPAATYFAGRELLAMTLRGEKGGEQSRYRAVARVVADLIEEGAIERTDTGRPGHNAVYRLTLDRRKSISSKPKKGGSTDHPVDGFTDHPVGGLRDPQRMAAETTPRSHEEPIEELSEERRGSAATASHPSRVPEADAAPVVELFPGVLGEARYGTAGRWSSRRDPAADAIAEASARRAAARAEHQARLAAERGAS